MRRIHIALIGTWVVLLALAAASDVAGQTEPGTPHIESMQGTNMGAGRVQITGRVVNPLPWDIADVEVVALFEEDILEPISRQTIALVPTGQSAGFTIEKTSRVSLNTFRAGVTRYTIRSNDVPAMLNLFNTGGDVALQTAAARSFRHMTSDALPSLLEIIRVSGRPTQASLEQTMQDLMSLDALTALGHPQSVQPLLDLLAWYDQVNGLRLDPIKAQLALDPFGRLSGISLLDSLESSDLSMADLIRLALVRIGPPAVPALLQATISDRWVVRQNARVALSKLDRDTVGALLAEPDPAILADIIAALGEIKRTDAVALLLELARDNAAQREAAERSLLSMGGAAVPALVSALHHPSGAVADHAERILRLQASAIVPELEQALREQEQLVPPQIDDPAVLVTTLRVHFDAQIAAETDVLFERGWAAFQAGDCAGAVEAMEAMFAVRDTLAKYATQAAQAYHCQARALATAAAYAEAIRLGRRAEQSDPGNMTIRADLVSWYVAQSEAKSNAGHLVETAGLLREALAREPNNPAARRLIGRIVSQVNSLYVLAGVVIVIVFVFVSARRANAQEQFHA
ncbi:MAG TPA: HEAT repeat domain-containing protein [Anaerolineae bacterium]|nr:HEAT repeat domain-containing protein [Anaerolineae bacterium]